MIRCDWVPSNNKLYIDYHDKEWGVPVQDDNIIFEFLVLESAQAGLSWHTILKKRENYRQAFCNFNPEKVSKFDDEKKLSLFQNPGIIRNKLKINAAINNARLFLKVQEEFGSFNKYIWRFVDGSPRINKFKKLEEVPDKTKESEAMSKDLKQRGFKFLGPTICYAHMQATGMVNDHIESCFRYREIIESY
ncbi:MAG TPA: DNA-3-methyladenine glycosylase I [Victivallales bacterium]|nr:DNA-3-methyladenine glycosylase I [Victivallales bacterium]